MKTKITFCLLLLNIISFYSESQCSVNIIPQGPTTFCYGDSVVLVASASGGVSAIDQFQLNYNAGTSARNLPGYSVWQSFTAGITGTLAEIEVGMFTAINGVGLFEVYQGTGTGGALLSTQTATVVCGGGNCMIPFFINVPVVSGITYTYSFTPGTGIPDPYGIQAVNPGTYSGGYFGLVDPSGTYNTGLDMVFQTHVTGISYLWSNSSTDTSIVANASGTYSVTITTNGCTSMANIHLTEIIVNTAVTVASTTLTAVLPSATYQWINCNGNTAITGATNQSYTATVNGNYAVVVTTNGCSDTSNCYNINSVGINEWTADNGELVIAPNPGEGIFQITNYKLQINGVEIYNILGELIYQTIISGNQSTIDLTNEPSGIYFLKITSDESTKNAKLIKK